VQIKSYLKTDQSFFEVVLFGYTSKGMPGIELTGLGAWSREVKQKIIYFSRLHQLNPPLLKYNLCCSLPWSAREMKKLNLSSLELPLTLMFWALGNKISLMVDDKTFSMGQISLPDTIEIICLDEYCSVDDKWLGLVTGEQDTRRMIDLQGVIQHIPSIKLRHFKEKLP